MIRTLLSKILPLDRLIALALRFGLLKEPLKLAAVGWKKAQGVRTQSLVLIAGLVALAASLGWIPWETAKPIIEMLVGVALPAALEKIHNLLPFVEKVSAKVGEEVKKNAPTQPNQ